MRNTQLQAYFETPMRGADREAVLKLLFAKVPGLLPARWSPDEQDWFDVDPAVGAALAGCEFSAMLDGQPAWDGYVGEGMLWIPRGLLWLGSDPNKVAAEKVAAFARSLPTVAAVRHVLVHAASEADRAVSNIYNQPAFGENDDPEQAQLLFPDKTLDATLPELWWGQLLGGDIAARFDVARLATVAEIPGASATQIEAGLWWVQVTPNPADPLTDWPAFDHARQRVKGHLGMELFRAP